MLRNRRTGETFIVENGRIKQQGFFKQTIDPVNVDSKISDMLDEIESNFAHLDAEKRNAIMTVIRSLAINNDFLRLCRNPAYLQKQIRALLEQHEAKKQIEQSVSLSGHSRRTGMLLAAAAINNAIIGMLPASVAALACIPLVASQMAYSASEGIPEGGQDFCSGKLFGCLQGFLTVNGTVVAQFQRALTSVGETDNGPYLQLKDCIDVEAMGELAFRVYNVIDGKKGITCSATQGQWKNYVVSGILSNMSIDACDAYKNEFGVLANECQSTLGAAAKTAQIAGGVLGGLCLLACCVAAGYAIAKGKAPKPPCLD